MNSRTTTRIAGGLRLTLASAAFALIASLAQTAQAAAPAGGPGASGMPGMHGTHAGGPGMHGGPGMQGMMGHPEHMNRMLESIGASAEQRAQIQAIMQAARADMKAQHEQTKALRDQGQALFVQPTVDARAVEALRLRLLAQHDQASKRKMQVMLDISRVLSPEQRQKLAEQKAQRRALMERHQAERAALEQRRL